MSISKKLRFEVLLRDGFKCLYCGRRPPQVTLEVDHVHPRSQGGQDHPRNLVSACYDCNRGKAARLLVEGVPIINKPVIPWDLVTEEWLYEDEEIASCLPEWCEPERVQMIPWSREAVEVGIVGLAPAVRTYTMAPDVCARIAEAFA